MICVLHLGKKALIWWKDICVVGAKKDQANCFTNSIFCKLGHGEFIDFWPDRWVGMSLCAGCFVLFSIKHYYDRIANCCNISFVFYGSVLEALRRLLRTKDPSNILIFGWRLVLNRLPTRSNLERRGVLSATLNLLCPLCGGECEDSNNLVGGYPVPEVLWNQAIDWIHIILPLELLSPIHGLPVLEVDVKVNLKEDFWVSYLLDYFVLPKFHSFLWRYFVKFDGLGMTKQFS